MKRNAFTLIELMTVIGIIAILAGLMLVGYNIFFEEADIGSSMRFDSSIHHSLGYALVGDWKLDDNADNSTIVDTSGNGNDGTFYSNGSEDNTANHSVDGANGRALEFDGVDDYINTPINISVPQNGHTFSVWAKSKGSTDQVYYSVFGTKNGSSNINYNLDHRNPTSTDQWLYEWYDENDDWHGLYSDNLSEVKENKWYYLVVVHGKINQYLYVNGKEEDSENSSGFYNSGLTVQIGSRNSNLNFYGSIDQMRFYKNTLSSTQIKQQYYTGLQRLYKKGLISREEYIKRIVQK